MTKLKKAEPIETVATWCVIVLIAEAERRGDVAELAVITQQKLELDRALRRLHGH